ncbi:MAG: toll/interleukin-1 receptor domain-containing protein [Thermoanaerobaculia bacterium]
MPAPSVFISYSHKDEVWKDRLVTHLGVLQNQGLLQTWTDRDIGAGDEWFEKIQTAMTGARVAVLLISASSLTSKFILHTEVPHLLERRAREGMAVFPVLCQPCLWQEIPWLARLQVRPRDGKALSSFRADKRESELAKIAKEILDIARNGSPVTAASGSATRSTGTSLPLAGGGTGAIFGLQGMGGVGKTTLALKLAEAEKHAAEVAALRARIAEQNS